MNSPGVFPCSRCDQPLSRKGGEFYLIDIRAVVDPVSARNLVFEISDDPEFEISQLLKRIDSLTEEQLVSEIYQRKLFSLCPNCYVTWMADPFGRESPAPRSST